MLSERWIAGRFRTSVRKAGFEIGFGGSGIDAAGGGINPITGFQIGRSIGRLSSSHKHPYLIYIKLLSPISWRYEVELPPEPRETMADPDAVLAPEALTHDLRWDDVWRWHDTPM